MAGTFLKWLIPGLLTVVGGTALAVTQTGAAISTDLDSRTTAALATGNFGWAHVGIDGRDAVLSGTATTRQMIEDATARLAAVEGVRTVRSTVALASPLSPFPFTAAIRDGAITLSGAYPDEAVHASLLAAVGNAEDKTALHSGAPESFEAAAKFGLGALADLDQGQVTLTDLSLNIVGRAKSPEAFDSLQTLPQSLPSGVQLAALTITPPLVSPYIWTATFDGTSISISGDAPTDDFAERLRALAPANVPVSTSLALASGEPSGFEANALALFTALLSLEQGEATIKDGAVTLIGAPASQAVADSVTAAVTRLGGTATLEPPRVADFSLHIEKTEGRLVFTGFVPDAATRTRLAALSGADITGLALGRGAPERFASGLDFGLEALSHLVQGEFGLKGDKMSLGGRATTLADYKAAVAMVAQGAPQGLSLAAAALHPPVANPFTWSATKDAAGKTTFAGFVPDEATGRTLAGDVAELAADNAEPADGAPAGFAASAQQGLAVLALLDSGTLRFDGANWGIEGAVDSASKGFAADAKYSEAGLRTRGWTYEVHLPTLPTIAPYVWRAQKAVSGAVSFSGFVPDDRVQATLKARAPDATDSTSFGAGAPDDFGANALAGLDALGKLDEGTLALSGTHWSLTGTTASSAARDSLQNALSTQIKPADWQIAIQAKDAAPIVSPYVWSATKAADGSIELAGDVPSLDLRQQATAKAGTLARDGMTVASGEPAGFAGDMLAGLEALRHLREGRAGYDGTGWLLTGAVASAADGDAAVAALGQGTRNGALWTMQVEGYPPASSEPSSGVSSSSEQPSSSEAVATPDVTSVEPPSSSASSSSLEPSSSSEAVSAAQPSSEPLAPSSSSEAPVSPSAPPVQPSSSDVAAPPSSSAEPANRDVAPEAIDVSPPMPDTLVFEATQPATGSIVLKGAVPDDASAKALATAAGGVTTSALTPDASLPADFVASASAGLQALDTLVEGHLGFDGSKWYLRGTADSPAGKNAVTATIAALPAGGGWSVGISVLAPLDACRVRVGALAGRNAIVFESGKAILARSSMPVLDELANDVDICPNAYIHVQGHTDSDGDADTNLGLSVARAEAVVAELIKRGVSESRLYAEGFGESEPLVANDSKDNKQKNRRIAFEIDEK